MNIDWIEVVSLALMIVPSTFFALAVIWLGGAEVKAIMAKLKCLNKDGVTYTIVEAEKWQDRDWYQPVAGQPVGQALTLIPTGMSTVGAKTHTVHYVDGNAPDAHVELVSNADELF